MHVLYIMEAWSRGGTEVYVERLAKGLRGKGIATSLFLLTGDVPEKHPFRAVYSLRNTGLFRYYDLISFIKNNCFDVIHLHLYTSVLPVTFYLKVFSRVAICSTWHSPIYAWNRYHKLLQISALKIVDAAIGGSNATQAELRAYRSDVVSISPPMTDRLEFVSAGSNKSFCIVGCGRLSREKNWTLLIEAISRLHHKNISVNCIIVGEGAERKNIESLINKLNIDQHVCMKGRLASDRVISVLSNANLFVLPSDFEGFGMAAVEAMALGIPTITSNFPASSEYLQDGVTGSHFEIGNVDDLVEKILWHYENSEQSRWMGLRGQELVASRYKIPQIAQKHLDVYKGLLETKAE